MTIKSIFLTLTGIITVFLSTAQIHPTTNFIGLDISTSPQNVSFTYDSSFALGTQVGMSRVGIYQNWTALETAPLTYNMAIMDIANYYYPAHHMSVDLTITPIHTNKLEVPSDLQTTAFDHPVFIQRFKSLLDSVKAHLPQLSLSSLVIGSEHDVYLGSNAALWMQYTNFYKEVSIYAKTLWPGLKVATELTFNGIVAQNTFAQTLNAYSDDIGVSYYPLNSNFTVKPVAVIPSDFATLVNLYPAKQICFYQYGFPSSTVCNSSETLQAQFIAQTFTTWDTYADHVKMIDFTWLHDLDTALVHYYKDYYGLGDPIFLEYLRTLGLRTWNGSGTNKAAFYQLQCEAKRRGYNQLNTNCSTILDVEQTSSCQPASLFPNPVQTDLSLELPFEVQNADLKIMNALGHVNRSLSGINGKKWNIATSDLPNGAYLLELRGDNIYVKEAFVVCK